MKNLGLIINPIAGLGGRVGLKGTDGLVDRALALGAKPLAGAKSIRALVSLIKEWEGSGAPGDLTLWVAPGEMGEIPVAQALGQGRENIQVRCPWEGDSSPIGLKTRLQAGAKTGPEETREAARALVERGVDLLLFAGGDGTARDVCLGVGEGVPALGIPAGVKIHSPVFARTPEAAGELAALYLSGRVKGLAGQEVLDLDEDAYRAGRVTPRLFGYLSVPESRTRIQGRKAGTPMGEWALQNQISLSIVDDMEKEMIYLVGPGTTIRPVMENLGLENSLLGVDIVQGGRLLLADASEAQILKIVGNRPFKIIITPIGGQGYLFGRGNHQFSPEVIRRAGRENIIVGATLQKIGSFRGQPFGVDTGDPAVDGILKGYIRVTTGYRQEMVHPVQ